MRFTKAHAYGNDFLYVEAAAVDGAALDALAREVCERHRGVGADGLLVYGAASEGVVMRLFNSDGSRAEVSGNGVRALGALLLQHDARTLAELTVHTEAGSKHLTRIGRHGSAVGAPPAHAGRGWRTGTPGGAEHRESAMRCAGPAPR